MRSLTLLITLIFYVIISSCNTTTKTENTIYTDVVVVSDTIVSSKVPIEIELYNPRQILNINDEYLVVLDDIPENIIRVFSLPEVKYLYSWGRKGEGPDAFQSLSFNSLNSFEDQIIIYKPALSKVQYFQVTDSLLIYKDERQFILNNEINIFSSLVRLNESQFISESLPENTRDEFIIIETDNSELIFSIGNYPESTLEGRQLKQEFAKGVAAKPDGSKFTSFYLMHNSFKIFDVNSGSSQWVKIKENQLNFEQSNRNGFFFRDQKVISNDEYIFTTGLYAVLDELSDIASFRPILEVWNWQGDSVSRSHFDKPIFTYAVSEKYGKVYALSILDGESIKEYDIQHIIQ